MGDDDHDRVIDAIDMLEEAADALQEAIDTHPDAAVKAKLADSLPKLQAVIDSLNQQYAAA